MTAMNTQEVSCRDYALEIDIRANRAQVWKAMFEDVNIWWLKDFHMAGEDSKVSFDPTPGGRGLLEEGKDGTCLQWYTVQFIVPAQFKVYLVGHIGPEWGGPCVSHMQLSLTESESGCRLSIHDALFGAVSEATTNSLSDGWKMLFGDGLKLHLEKCG